MDTKILNPLSGRYVLKTGKIGSAIVQKQRKTVLSHGCKNNGMMQSIGTCWFNSIFNNLLLSQRAYSYFMNKYKELPENERKLIETTDFSENCPLTIQKSHFYHFFYKYHLDKPKNRLLSYINRPKHAQKLINKLNIRSPDWEKERQGYYIDGALKKILPIIFDKHEYIMIDTKHKHKIYKKTDFIFVDKPIIAEPVIYNNYVIDHAVIVLTLNKDAHVISAYKCENDYYIYDSNSLKYHKVDWTNLDNLKKYMQLYKFFNLFNKGSTFELSYEYICYIMP